MVLKTQVCEIIEQYVTSTWIATNGGLAVRGFCNVE